MSPVSSVPLVDLRAVGPDLAEVGGVVHHDVRVLGHDHLEASEVDAGPVGRIRGQRQLAEIDRELPDIARVTAGGELLTDV